MSWQKWGLHPIADDAPREAVLATGGRLLILGADEWQHVEDQLSPRWRICAVTMPVSPLRPQVGDLVVWRGLPREDPDDWYLWGGPTRVVSTAEAPEHGLVELCVLEDVTLPDADATAEDLDQLEDYFSETSETVREDGVVAPDAEWDILSWWRLAPRCPRCGGPSEPIVSHAAEMSPNIAHGGFIVGQEPLSQYLCHTCGHVHRDSRYATQFEAADSFELKESTEVEELAVCDPFRDLVSAVSGADVVRQGSWITFTTTNADYVAIVKEGANRIRVEAYLSVPDRFNVLGWVDRQPPPSSGALETFQNEHEEHDVLLAFERSLGDWDWSTDPLPVEVAFYADALAKREDVKPENLPAFATQGTPIDVPPASAWLLVGDEASFPTTEELASSAAKGKVGIFDDLWTAAKQTQFGDLVLIYFMSPRKAVHFVARAASDAFFDREIAVNAERTVADEQRWAYLTPLIEIEPIPFAALQAASNNHLILRGRSGKFLRPETIQQLTFKAANPRDQAELDRVIKVPVGRADLPAPASIDIDLWRTIAAGALALESDVERYIVEPLLRHLLPETHVHQRQHRLRTGVVDYVVTSNSEVVSAVEVKLAIPRPPSGDWGSTAEFMQLRRYIDHLRVPGLLIDAHRVVLVEPDATAPVAVIERTTCTQEELEVIRRHLMRTATRS